MLWETYLQHCFYQRLFCLYDIYLILRQKKHTSKIQLFTAVHHLDFATLHLDGGHSPYMNKNLLSVECKHSKPSTFYSCTAHFSTKIVPEGKMKARKCPFHRLLRAFQNYSNSIVAGGFPVQSYSTLLTPFTSFTILLVTFPSTSQGICAASAVMKSEVFTARSAMA